MTKTAFHAKYQGVVPEIASRKHTEWIDTVVKEALDAASDGIDAVAVTARPASRRSSGGR